MSTNMQSRRQVRRSLSRHSSASGYAPGFTTIDVRIRERVAYLSVSGHFDYYAHHDFRESYMPLLADPAIGEIRVEISKVVYLDIPALGMLLLLNERASAAHKKVALITSAGGTWQMLAAANFSKIFNIHQVKAEGCGLPARWPAISMCIPRIALNS